MGICIRRTTPAKRNNYASFLTKLINKISINKKAVRALMKDILNYFSSDGKLDKKI
jgi:hypothetical protein